ncbi:unnamed protein product [Larinioides sclopetarius]|uniref:Uncharacterized protein n=1 Tax=Larinioides sclopetarius TaxID=280406 RepID=A0AAV2AH24_9ARAC
MNTLTIFTILLVFICSCLADDEEASKHSQESPQNSQRIAFSMCVACGGEEVKAAYKECKELKTENTTNITEECVAKILPENVMEGDKRFEYYCHNPEDIDKVYDCFYDYYETLTEEDKASLKKFRECAAEVNEEFCQEESDESTESPDP